MREEMQARDREASVRLQDAQEEARMDLEDCQEEAQVRMEACEVRCRVLQEALEANENELRAGRMRELQVRGALTERMAELHEMKKKAHDGQAVKMQRVLVQREVAGVKLLRGLVAQVWSQGHRRKLQQWREKVKHEGWARKQAQQHLEMVKDLKEQAALHCRDKEYWEESRQAEMSVMQTCYAQELQTIEQQVRIEVELREQGLQESLQAEIQGQMRTLQAAVEEGEREACDARDRERAAIAALKERELEIEELIKATQVREGQPGEETCWEAAEGTGEVVYALPGLLGSMTSRVEGSMVVDVMQESELLGGEEKNNTESEESSGSEEWGQGQQCGRAKDRRASPAGWQEEHLSGPWQLTKEDAWRQKAMQTVARVEQLQRTLSTSTSQRLHKNLGAAPRRGSMPRRSSTSQSRLGTSLGVQVKTASNTKCGE